MPPRTACFHLRQREAAHDGDLAGLQCFLIPDFLSPQTFWWGEQRRGVLTAGWAADVDRRQIFAPQAAAAKRYAVRFDRRRPVDQETAQDGV